MKMHLRTAILAALVAAPAATASAQTSATTATQPGPGWSVLKSYTGTIVRVDADARLVTTRDARGQTAVFEAPPSLASSQLASFPPGDVVTVTFYEGVEVRPKPAGGAPVATSVDPATGLRTATVTITAIDPVARTVTFIGPRGRYTRTVPEGVDASQLRVLTIGERAELTYFEYVQSMTRTAVAVASIAAPPAAPTPDPDSLRNRLTVYALYGVDNQFSGKMIEAATGRTTGGVPIDFDETTYDEVYGRMGMFKVGVGYRLTPRTEAVVNFVYSSSAANDEAIQIGTAGTSPQAPLNVNFTEYQYLGLRGRPAVVLHARAFHTVCRLARRHQPPPGHPRHVRRRAVGRHTGPRRPGRQVLRKVVGVQPRTNRWRLDRGRAVRSDGRGATALPRRAVGRGLAGGGRPA